MPSAINHTVLSEFLQHGTPAIDVLGDLASEPRPIAYKTYDLSSYLKSGTPLNERDPNLPEYAPYHRGDIPRTFIEEKELSLWDQLKLSAWEIKAFGLNFARHTAQRIQDYFFEKQFYLLLDLAHGRQVRVTKRFPSRFSSKEELYGLSKWSFAQWFGGNALTQLYYEGILFARSAVANAAKIAEITPRILVDKAKEIQRNFDQDLEPLTRQAAAVLKDDHYEDLDGLMELWENLKVTVADFRRAATDLEMDNDKFGDTSLKKTQKAINELFAQAEKNSGYLLNEKKWYQVNELKVSLAEFFKRADKYSGAVRKGLDEVILTTGQSQCATSVERLRDNIAGLIHEVHALKSQASKHIEEMIQKLEFFEEDRHRRVRF